MINDGWLLTWTNIGSHYSMWIHPTRNLGFTEAELIENWEYSDINKTKCIRDYKFLGLIPPPNADMIKNPVF